jgi:hypothetical protein
MGTDSTLSSMYSPDFDVRDALLGVHQQLFGFGVLQAGLVRHHQPAAESLVVAAVAVDGHADVHLALVQLLGSLGQGRLHGAQDHIALNVLLARNGLNQHQQFAIHATTLLFLSPAGGSCQQHQPTPNHPVTQPGT